MNAVYGLYDNPDAAQRAVDGLRATGVADADIHVMSSEPFEEYEFGHKDSASWIHWVAGLGGVGGFTGAYLLTTITQQSWPLKTSGMPIVAPWPNLIVMFELTMLGAILATVATLFVSARLPRTLPALYDPEVSNGYILVGVERTTGASRADITGALEAVGEGRVKTVGGS